MERGLMNVESISLGEELIYVTTVPLPPVPLVPPARTVRFDAERCCFVTVEPRERNLPTRLQEDAYLRAAQVDWRDPVQMEQFINRYGSPGADPVWHHDRPIRRFEKGHRLEPFGLGRIDEDIKRQIKEEWETPPSIGDESFASVQYGFRSIQEMTYIYYLLSGQPNDTIEKVGGRADVPADIDAVAKDEGLRSVYTGPLVAMLDDALSVFAPRIFYTYVAPSNGAAARLHDSAIAADAETRPPLFCVLALQLAHAMQETWEVTTCGDERCQRLFNWQEGGRAPKGARHRGSKYCDEDCARRKTQREWKRAKRAKKRQLPPA